jgi:hypothetical protein
VADDSVLLPVAAPAGDSVLLPAAVLLPVAVLVPAAALLLEAVAVLALVGHRRGTENVVYFSPQYVA